MNLPPFTKYQKEVKENNPWNYRSGKWVKEE